MVQATFFATPKDFRAWLRKNHATAPELWVGFHKSENLPEPDASLLRKNTAAWKFFQAQPPSYRKTIGWWVTSAKQAETRRRRLEKLIAASAAGRRLR